MTVAIGSPGYMPKEQRLFYPRFCSDIYAVGIVCMQALSGLRPKQLSVDPATQELYCSRLGDRISISPGFAAILDKMVRCDYRQRYENATVALQALREFLGSSKSLSSPIRSFVPNPDSDETQPKTASAITPTIRPPQRLSKHHNLSCSEPSISSENLSNDFKKRLEQLLAEFLGPIASLILKSALSDASTFGELITHLSMVITAQRRSHFCQQAHLLSQDLGNNSISLVQNQSSIDSTSYPFLKVSPDFIKQCEVELTTLIGPIASVFVQRTVSLTPNLSSAELINALTRYVRDTKVAETFRRTLYTRL
jgi:serine/threonine-protein kinase